MTRIDQIQLKNAILTTPKLISDANTLVITSGTDISIDLSLPDFFDENESMSMCQIKPELIHIR